jgi:hypothetical protein
MPMSLRLKISGVVIGRFKVVKSVKMKSPEIAPLKMLLLHAAHRPLRRVLSSCRSSRKSEWRRPLLVH